MSWRERPLWLMAPLTLLLVAVLAFGFAQSRRYEDPFNVEGIALLETLKRVEAERQSAVLRSRIGLVGSYDELTRGQRDVQDTLDALDARSAERPRGESAPLSDFRRALRLAIERENELVEQFKSSHSLLANSLSFLPTAAREIGGREAGRASAPALVAARAAADRLLLASALYSQHAAHVTATDIAGLLRLLEQQRAAVPEAERIPLDLFRAHVETVLREQENVDATLREIDTLGTGTKIEAARARLAEEAQEDAAHGATYRRFLLGFSSVLIVLFAASAIYLVKSLGVIRRVNRALNDVNDGLELRVAERTRELFDANLVLDRTGRIGGVGGWQLDVATMTVLWTDQTRRIHELEPGYRPSVETGLCFYAPEARPTIAAAVETALAGGSGYDLELPFVTAKGREIWVRAMGEPQFEDGKVVRLIGAFQDITGRRAMEAELRHNHEVLSTVMENLPCGLSVFDGDLKLIASNRAYRTLLGFPDALFDGRVTTLEDILRFNQSRGDYDGLDAEAAIDAFMEQGRHPPQSIYFERTRPNGHPLEVRGGPLPGGGFVLTHTDVSERIDAEEKRLQSEQLLRSAIDAVDEGFVLFDADDRLVYCNETYRGTFHGSAGLIVPGVSFERIQHLMLEADIFDAGTADHAAWVADRMALRRSGDTTIVRRLHDGRVLRAIDRRTPDGHTIGLRADITELVRATDEAQAASLAKSRFMANMSHEIRTPMNAILGMLTLLRRTGLNARQSDYAARTDSAARSLLVLLNDILDFAKVEAGKMALEHEPFDTAGLLGDLTVIASASVGAKPIRLLFDLDPGLPAQLVGDSLRLQQVLVNLLGNAIKFTEAGEVALSVAVVDRTGRSIVLEFAVRDTGIGIAAENHERIFGGFTQAESSTTRRFGGTGLGLTISQRLVALMGGRLVLESEPGAGSRFHFRVELDTGDDAAPRHAGIAPGDGVPLRLLLVDEHPAAREVVARAAGTLGWRIDVAASADAARALLKAGAAVDGGRFDAIVVSAGLALSDPVATVALSRDAVAGGTSLRLVAGSQDARDRLARSGHTEGAGFDAYLVEPVTPATLLAALALPGRLPAPSVLPMLHSCTEAASITDATTADATRPRRLEPTRVLLVEDNIHNQQVARELLEDEGATVRIANDGQEAFDLLARPRSADAFDIVLMDLQMPVMDGLTASRRIRGHLGVTMPIVAMTANASAADREACVAAGMNDHVGKPFDLDALVACVLRHTGRAAVAAVQPSAAPPLADSIGAVAAAGGIAVDAALLRLGGNRPAYRRLLTRFVEHLADAPAEWRAEAGRDTLLRRSHTLKGLAATLGATALSAAAAAAEARLRADGSPADVGSSVAQVRAAIDAARPGLAALLDAWPLPPRTVGNPPPRPLDDAAVHDGLERIAHHLRHADMAALDAIDALQDRAGRTTPELDALRAAIVDLEFERALALCEDLLGDAPSDAAPPGRSLLHATATPA